MVMMKGFGDDGIVCVIPPLLIFIPMGVCPAPFPPCFPPLIFEIALPAPIALLVIDGVAVMEVRCRVGGLLLIPTVGTLLTSGDDMLPEVDLDNDDCKSGGRVGGAVVVVVAVVVVEGGMMIESIILKLLVPTVKLLGLLPTPIPPLPPLLKILFCALNKSNVVKKRS